MTRLQRPADSFDIVGPLKKNKYQIAASQMTTITIISTAITTLPHMP